MPKKKKILVPVLAVFVLAAALLTFLYFFDVNRFKPLISETVKTYTGRDLTIQGDIRLTTFWPLGLTAEAVSFQNAPWGSQPDMVRVERLDFSIPLKPLLKGNLRIANIHAQGVEVRLEFDARGVSNFLLEVPAGTGPAAMPSLAFRDIRIQQGRLVYIDHRWNGNLSMQVDHLAADIPGMDKPITARIEGRIKEIPCTMEGSVGPIAHWVLPGNAQYFELKGRLGQTNLGLRGDIRDPIALKDTSLHLTADGPSARDIFTLVGIKTLPDPGRFAVEAQLNDLAGPFALASLTVDAGAAEQVGFSIDGSIENIGQMRGIDLDLGLRTTRAGNLMQLAGMPALSVDAPLSATVTVTDTAHHQYRLENFSLALGQYAVKGSMELDLSRPHPVLDMLLEADTGPLGPTTLTTRLSGSLERIGIEHLDLQMGTTQLAKLHISGSTGSLYPLEDLRLTVHMFGEDLARVQQHFQQPVVVKGPFALTGQILMADRQSVTLPEVKVILDRNSITGNLQLNLGSSRPVMSGVFSANRLNLQRLLSQDVLSPDLKKHLTAVGPSRLAFEVSAPFSRPTLNDFSLQTRIRDMASVVFSGSVGDLLAMQAAELYFAVNGPELSNLEKLIGQTLFLKGPFALSGRIYDQNGPVYRIDNLDVSLSENTLKGRSAIDLSGRHPVFSLDLTTENLTARAFPDGTHKLLDRLKARGDLGKLAIRADIQFSGEAMALDNLQLSAGDEAFIRVNLSGSIAGLPAFNQADLHFQAAGQDIAVLNTLLDKPLPAQGSFALSGRLSDHQPNNFMLSDLDFSLGPNRFTGWTNLNLTGPSPVVESELMADHFTFSTLTLAEIDALKEIPDMGPVKLAVKLAFADGSPSVSYLDFNMGSIDTVSVVLRGSVGSLAPLGRVTLDFDIASRDLSLLKRAYGTGLIDALPFRLSGRLEDERPGRISLTSLDATYGDSDLSGSATLALAGRRPAFIGRFSSARLDLRPFINKLGDTEQAPRKSAGRNTRKERVFSTKPFDLTVLQTADVDITLEAQQLLVRKFAYNHVKIDLKLENGDLTIDPLYFDIGGGNAQAAMTLNASLGTPAAAVDLAVSRFDIAPMLEQLDLKSSLEGSLNITLHLDGRGNSLAELMAGLNGNVYLDINDGKVQSQQLATLERYLGSNVLDLLNPFKQKASRTTINCLISAIEIVDGETDFKMVLDTEQTALAVAGTIDLKKEALDIAIKPTPKKGFGEKNLGYISFSLNELSQPFALGGTLARPQLVLDPARTIITAGKFAGAIAFGPIGLTLFFSDISVGKKNICEEAKEALKAE